MQVYFSVLMKFCAKKYLLQRNTFYLQYNSFLKSLDKFLDLFFMGISSKESGKHIDEKSQNFLQLQWVGKLYCPDDLESATSQGRQNTLD